MLVNNDVSYIGGMVCKYLSEKNYRTNWNNRGSEGMAFRYGQNYQTVHIYNEIHHMEIEPYKYTLKLQIYISNRIHTIEITHMYIEVTLIYRTKYRCIEITHI